MWVHDLQHQRQVTTDPQSAAARGVAEKVWDLDVAALARVPAREADDILRVITLLSRLDPPPEGSPQDADGKGDR